MQRDKAALAYGGEVQTARAFRLLEPHCERVFLSNRSEQADWPGHAGFPQIHDDRGEGPLAGILCAMRTAPGRAWLVLACDLPYLDPATLAHLVANRDRARIATAYKSAHDGKPEPLCAIYEPAGLDALQAIFDGGLHCPRRALMQSDIRLLEPINPAALDNVNNPEDYEAARRVLEDKAP